MAAVDEGILHFPDQPVVISHHLSLSAMQICWALLLLLRTEGTTEPVSKYKVDRERRKAGSFTLLVMIDFSLYSCMLMNQLTLVFPQFSQLRSLCWTPSAFFLLINCICYFVMHSTASWHCSDVTVPPGTCILIWLFLWKLSCHYDSIDVKSKSSVPGNMFLFYNPLTKLSLLWLTTSWSHPLVRYAALSPCFFFFFTVAAV